MRRLEARTDTASCKVTLRDARTTIGIPMRKWFLVVLGSSAFVALAGCTTARAPDPSPAARDASSSLRASEASVDASASGTNPDASDGAPAPPAQLDPDGNDDRAAGSETTTALYEHATFTAVGKPPLGLSRICDLRAFGGKLYAAHANQPLGTDGATITTYRPEDAKTPFSVAFDWNRFGEPTKGGGGGQGFLRVHAIDGRLFVPDADPPYGGLGAVDYGTEGYVFISDRNGAFARARHPHAGLPGLPDSEGRAGASVLPRAYHVLDVVKFRGHLYASTGSVPPDARAWSGPSPGALHVAKPDLSRFTYALGFPSPYPGGVWRLTYLTRFRDKLYAGIQDYDGRSPFDYARFTLPEGHDVLSEADAVGKRVTALGAAFTLRWYTDHGTLYWIAGTHDGNISLRKTTDGETWDTVDLPQGVGRPTDIVRFRGHLVVLTERGLVALDVGLAPRVLATVASPDAGAVKKSPFGIDDILCAAPLAVLDDQLYAGGQRGAVLYRVDAAPE